MILDERFEAKALLTGASGFVGGRLKEALVEAGADVIAIRRKSSPTPKEDGARSVVADYADVDGLTQLIADEKPDYVFHVAGVTKGVSYEDFQRGNVLPTRNLLQALEAAHPQVKRYLMVSSLASYGPSSKDKPLREDDPRAPIEHYGSSKREAEDVLRDEARAVAWTIIRPGGVYGPGDGDYFNLFQEVSRGRNVYFGNRERLFSAVYVDDCVRAIVAAAASDSTVGKGYFVCDGKPISWQDFQQLIVDASGQRVRELDLPGFLVPLAAVGGELMSKIDKKPRLFNRQKAKMGAQEAWTCTHQAAREDFGYRPRVPVAEGVSRAYAWYRDNGWL